MIRHGLHVVYFMYFAQAMHNKVRRKHISCNGKLPSGTWCKQMVISCWSVHSRRHIWHEEARERAESYLPETWSPLCYTWSTGSRPLYTMWQRYPGNTRRISILVSETLYLLKFQIWLEVKIILCQLHLIYYVMSMPIWCSNGTVMALNNLNMLHV